MKRFEQFDGLRGLLALWVVVGHLTVFSGLSMPRWLATLANATKPVDVFIILSGFVITHMIVERPESYLPYITRRFFRLWPVLVLTCLIGWLTYDLFIEAVRSAPNVPHILRILEGREASIYANPIAHFVAHASMLHGAIPDEFLWGSDGTFVGTAWSTSLEWQFYLLAPLAIWAARTRRGAIALLLICVILMTAYSQKAFGHYYRYSTIVGACGYFLVGIMSRLRMDDTEAATAQTIALTISMAILLFVNPIPIVMWGLFYAALISERRPAIFDRIFLNRCAKYLGDRSYSIYLVHIVVLGVVMWFITRLSSSLTSGQMAVALLPYIPISIAISHVVHEVIEKPGISLGRQFAQYFRSAHRNIEALQNASASGD